MHHWIIPVAFNITVEPQRYHAPTKTTESDLFPCLALPPPLPMSVSSTPYQIPKEQGDPDTILPLGQTRVPRLPLITQTPFFRLLRYVPPSLQDRPHRFI